MATDSEQIADRLLVDMEDQRDAALLERDRLKLEVAALEQTVHHLLDQRDKAIEERDAERALRIGLKQEHLQTLQELGEVFKAQSARASEDLADAKLDVEGLGYEVAALRSVVDAAKAWRTRDGFGFQELAALRDLRRALDVYVAWEAQR